MSSSWRPAAWIVFGAVTAVGLVLVLLRPSEPPPPIVAPPATPSAPSVTPSPSFPDPPDATAAPPPSASNTNLMWNEDAGVYMLRLDNGEIIPLPPGVTSASVVPQLPAEKPQTNEWKLEKTQHIFALVDDRAKRVDKEAEDLEKQGKKQEAAEKRILATRLRKQLESMKGEMADYQKQIVSDGGIVDGDLYYDAAK